MPKTKVSTEWGHGWAIVRLSSDKGLNKLGTRTLVNLKGQILSAAGLPDVKCIGLLGEGGSFAVGADLREIRDLKPDTAREFSDLGNSLFRTMERSEVFFVAGIDGFCLGGGLDLALAADWRLGTERSVFGHPGADLGLITGFGGTQRLSRLIGSRRAMLWFLTADRLSGRGAYDQGLLQELCRDGDFEARFIGTVERFAAAHPRHLRECKRQLREAGRG